MELKELLKKSKEELNKRKAARAAASQKTGTRKPVNKNKMPEGIAKTCRRFGVKSIEELVKVNTAEKKYAYLGSAELEKVKNLKEDVDIAMTIAAIFKKPVQETKYYKEELQFSVKALGITPGDEGFEWIPTLVAESYIDEFNLERKISGLFTEIRMPSNPYKWPVLTNGAIARRTGQASAVNKQVFKTDETIQFDAEKMSGRYELPEELNEDSAPDVIRVIRQELIEGQEKAMEIGILEGDSAGALHHFSQLPDVAAGTTIASIAAETPETVFDGLRKRAMAAGAAAQVDVGGANITETELSALRAKMGKFGVDPSQLALISGPKVYNGQLLALDDVRTIEQYGGQATVVTGELARYEGMPVIVSEYLREDLAATGVNTSAGPNNTASIMIVNRKRFWTGLRRAIQVRVENNKTEFDVLDLVTFSRRAFQGVLKADGSNFASESSVVVAYNIAL